MPLDREAQKAIAVSFRKAADALDSGEELIEVVMKHLIPGLAAFATGAGLDFNDQFFRTLCGQGTEEVIELAAKIQHPDDSTGKILN